MITNWVVLPIPSKRYVRRMEYLLNVFILTFLKYLKVKQCICVTFDIKILSANSLLNFWTICVNNPKYKRQCELLPSYFRKLVKLRILLINGFGKVSVIEPYESIEKYFDEILVNMKEEK